MRTTSSVCVYTDGVRKWNLTKSIQLLKVAEIIECNAEIATLPSLYVKKTLFSLFNRKSLRVNLKQSTKWLQISGKFASCHELLVSGQTDQISDRQGLFSHDIVTIKFRVIPFDFFLFVWSFCYNWQPFCVPVSVLNDNLLPQWHVWNVEYTCTCSFSPLGVHVPCAGLKSWNALIQGGDCPLPLRICNNRRTAIGFSELTINQTKMDR